jgi:hypothetical protein
LQRLKNPIATFKNHLLQHPKTPIATREKKKACKTALTLELAGTLATAASLRSRGGGGEGALRSRGGGGRGGLRSREEPTYLVGVAVVVLVSGGRSGTVSLGNRGTSGGCGREEATLAGRRGGSELGTAFISAGGAAVEWRGTAAGVSKERIRMSTRDNVWETACGRGESVRRGFTCVRSRLDDCHISLLVVQYLM